MEKDKLNFIKNEFPKLLRKLHPDTPRKWGQMSAQQMVEHLTDYVRVASGKSPSDVVTSDEHLPAFKRFLESEKQFRPDTKNPLNTGPPATLRLKNLDDAIAEYEAEMNDFYSFFEKEPDKKTAHPAFGYLNAEEWMKLQYKHLTHHARQFGLIDEE